jgi:hypothetical protein
MDGIRNEWAAEAEIDFGPRYRTADAARVGVQTWGAICRHTEGEIAKAQAAGNTWFADYQRARLSGYRMELEHAKARVAELEKKIGTFPDFCCDNETAPTDMKARAETEVAQ